MVGRRVSFWDGLFSGAMLLSCITSGFSFFGWHMSKLSFHWALSELDLRFLKIKSSTKAAQTVPFPPSKQKKNMAISLRPSKMEKKWHCVTLGFSFGVHRFFFWEPPPPPPAFPFFPREKKNTPMGGDDVVLSRWTCGHPWWLGLKLCFATFGPQSFIGCLWGDFGGEISPTPKMVLNKPRGGKIFHRKSEKNVFFFGCDLFTSDEQMV